MCVEDPFSQIRSQIIKQMGLAFLLLHNSDLILQASSSNKQNFIAAVGADS